MEIVIALAPGQKGNNAAVAGRVFKAVAAAPQRMGQRIDEKGAVLGKRQAKGARQQEHADDITNQPAEQQWQAQTHEPGQRPVKTVLPHDHRVALQITHLVKSYLAGGPVPGHAAPLGMPETAGAGIRIALALIDIAMMNPMTGGPHQNGVLQRLRSEEAKE